MIRGDWSRLPDDLLRQIVENYMATVEDYVMFSCVCQSWYSVARDSNRSQLRKKWTRQMPLLMLTDGNTEIYDVMKKRRSYAIYECAMDSEASVLFRVKDVDYVKKHEPMRIKYLHSDGDDDTDDENNSEETNATRCMLNLSGRKNNKCYKASLPEAYGRSCWGSRYGWIVTLGCDRRMYLLNPLTKSTLPLPSQWTFPFPWKGASGKTIRFTFIDRAVLLLVPRDNGCHSHSHISLDSPCSATDYNNGIWLVVAIHRGIIASIAKPGDSSWTPILRPYRSDNKYCYLADVTYCTHLKSLLFVDCEMKVFICDLSDIEHPQVMTLYFKGRQNWMEKPVNMLCCKFYFVDSGGKTLIISRYIMVRHEVDYYEDFKIEDYREFESHLTFYFRVHKIKSHSNNLKEIHDLGTVALFVGHNATISVCSTEVGCEANCIYFCDDDCEGPPTNRFSGHDMGMFKMDDKKIRPFYDGHRSNSSYCSPFWFCPSL